MAQMVKNPPAMWETWVWCLGWERSPGGGHGNPLQYSCLENSHGQRSLGGYNPWCRKELDMTEPLHFTSSLILLVELQNMKMKFTFSIAFVIAHCIEIIMTMALNQFKNFDIFFTKYITCLHRVTILLKWENCKGICCDNMCLFSRKKYMIWKYS